MPIAEDIRVFLKQVLRDTGNARKTRLSRAPMPVIPKGIENEYTVDLLSIVKDWQTAYIDIIQPYLPDLVEQSGIPRVRQDNWSDTFSRLMDSFTQRVKQLALPIIVFAQNTAQKVNRHNSEQWQKQVNSVLGTNVYSQENTINGQLDSFVKRNVALIQKLSQDTTSDIENIIRTGITNGTRVETITKQVMGSKGFEPASSFRKARNRARLIAVDQVNKLNGELTMARQTSLGVERYIWETAQDERVRPSHAAKQGNIYRWDEPPADTGHPGQDYRCRCVALPVFDDVLEQV